MCKIDTYELRTPSEPLFCCLPISDTTHVVDRPRTVVRVPQTTQRASRAGQRRTNNTTQHTPTTPSPHNMGQKQSALSVAAPSSTPTSVAKEISVKDHSPHTTTAATTATMMTIESRSNPPPDDAASHNFGQPRGDKTGGASKLVTDCRIQQRASLACIEENYHNKDVACSTFFDAYKKCRREEHERKLEANAKGW